MDEYIRGNQHLWDEWAEINFHSDFYDVAGFKAHPDPLAPVIRAGVGDVAGRSLLHLQCHFGKDTLRWALAGATVTGIDISGKAIAFAKRLAAEMQIPATFVRSNLYDLPTVLDGQYEVIFTSYGVLGWLPDLDQWGAIIARFLKPGGIFYIIEAHPTLLIFDDNDPHELRVKFPYFHVDAPLVFPPHQGNYADPSAVVTQTEYNWQHSMADVITPLLKYGLSLEFFAEYPHLTWKALPFMVEDDDGYSWLPPEYPSMPLSFALRARKPEEAPSERP